MDSVYESLGLRPVLWRWRQLPGPHSLTACLPGRQRRLLHLLRQLIAARLARGPVSMSVGIWVGPSSTASSMTVTTSSHTNRASTTMKMRSRLACRLGTICSVEMSFSVSRPTSIGSTSMTATIIAATRGIVTISGSGETGPWIGSGPSGVGSVGQTID